MITYEENGHIKGIHMSETSSFKNVFSAFSVDSKKAKRGILLRRSIAWLTVSAYVFMPLAFGIAAGVTEGVGSGIAAGATVVAFELITMVFGLGAILESLFSNKDYYSQFNIKDKAGRYRSSETYLLSNSLMFSQRASKDFWDHFLKLKDQDMLREAAEMVFKEHELREVINGMNKYLLTTHQSAIKGDVDEKRAEVLQKIKALEESFDEFAVRVIEFNYREKDAEVLHLMEKADRISAHRLDYAEIRSAKSSALNDPDLRI